MNVTPINTVVINGQWRTFDRIALEHPKQRQYLLRDVLQTPTPEEEKFLVRGWRFHWSGAPYLDQGAEGACVGFGWANYFNAGPITCKPPLQNSDARRVYELSKEYDEWAGSDYDGSSVNGGALAMRSTGRITGFRWSFSPPTTIDALLMKGPVVGGCDWFSGMFRPDSKGFLHVTGSIVGGHAFAVVGVNAKKGYVRIKNSWGREWGQGGFAKLSLDDFAKLHENHGYGLGEFCIADEVCLKS